MQNKIMNVNKWLLGSTKEKKSWPRKWLQWLLPDSHHWYLPCSSVGSYRFYRIVIFVSVNRSRDRSLDVLDRSPDVRHTGYYWSVPHTIATRDWLCRHFYNCADKLLEILGAVLPVTSLICISLLYRNISSRSTNRTSWLIASTASAAVCSGSGRGRWQALSGKGRFSLSAH